MERVSSNVSLIAAQISSFETRTTPSTVSLADTEASSPHDSHRSTVGKETHFVEEHPSPGFQRLRQSVGVEGLDSNDLDVRGSDALDVSRDNRRAAHLHRRSRRMASTVRHVGLTADLYPMVPWPAMTRGWSNVYDGQAVPFGQPGALPLSPRQILPEEYDLGAHPLTLAVLISGVPFGITMYTECSDARPPSQLPEHGCPQRHAMTPFHFCSESSCCIMLNAPRSLKLKDGLEVFHASRGPDSRFWRRG